MRPGHAILYALLAAGLGAHAAAAAESWPTRPLTMVVPFAAGGGTDVMGRIVGRRLSEVLGQQVIIENVGGAGGMVGSARVAKAAPDGYTFVLGSRADAINQTLYKNPLYNLATDLAPVVLIADQPTVLVARKDLPVDNLQQFIAYARKSQVIMQYGSAGAGSTGHVDCALLNAAIGVTIAHVPYRGGGPAMQDLIAGRIDYFCTLSGTVPSQIEGKLVKPIANLSRERSPMLPALATAQEQGLAFRCVDLVRLLRAGEHAGRRHPEAPRRHRRGDGHALRAGAPQGGRREDGRARAPFAGVSATVRGQRNREERRAD